jgi:FKBP-type peptidyl-prolyl cis-trans isomerase
MRRGSDRQIACHHFPCAPGCGDILAGKIPANAGLIFEGELISANPVWRA